LASRRVSRTCHMSAPGSPCGLPGDSSPPRPRASTEVLSGEEVIVEEVTRRVVFLDIDGVLAPIRRWDRYGDLDPACIQVLNEIVARGSADVVVSSTWRHGKTVAELQEILEAEGFTGFVLDKTPTGEPGADRGEEIAAWLTEHAVGGYVTIAFRRIRPVGYNQPTHRVPSRCSCDRPLEDRSADRRFPRSISGGRAL